MIWLIIPSNHYIFDTADRLVKVTDSNNNEINYNYDLSTISVLCHAKTDGEMTGIQVGLYHLIK